MPDKTPAVVVGIDGSDNSIHAARWAAAVADRYGSPVHLVHSLATAGHFISDASVIAIRAAAGADQREAAQKVLTAAQEAVHEAHAHVAVTTEIVSDTADHALTSLSQDAALVVVGCDDVTRTAALLIGSTSLSVAMHAKCPVVAWRGIPEPDTTPVVVGVDNTPAGEAALGAGFSYADRFGAPLKAVRSWYSAVPADPMVIPYFIDWEAIIEAEKNALNVQLERWTKRYPHVKAEPLVESVKPSRALLDHLDGAQLIVVGNHRRSTFTTAVLGTTTLNMLHHSAIPVMVCHA